MTFNNKQVLFAICVILSVVFVNNTEASDSIIVERISTDGTILNSMSFDNNSSDIYLNNDNNRNNDVLIKSNDKNLNINNLSISNGIKKVDFDLPSEATLKINYLNVKSNTNTAVNLNNPTIIDKLITNGKKIKIIINKLLEIGTTQS